MVQRLPLATHDGWELVQVTAGDDVEAGAEWVRCLKTFRALHPNGDIVGERGQERL